MCNRFFESYYIWYFLNFKKWKSLRYLELFLTKLLEIDQHCLKPSWNEKVSKYKIPTTSWYQKETTKNTPSWTWLKSLVHTFISGNSCRKLADVGNANTAYLDLSFLYGSDEETALNIRSTDEGQGLLKIQVNRCQKLVFLHQLAHNMRTDCSLNYKFNTWKF